MSSTMTSETPAADEATNGHSEKYGVAFPPLSTGDGSAPAPVIQKTVKNYSKPMTQLRSSTVTQVFHVPLEERRYKNLDGAFSNDRQRQAGDCAYISKTHGVEIETNLARDQSLAVVLTGKADAVMKAKRDVVSRLQTQASAMLTIPKEHYRFILGPKGAKLAELELLTATKILIPRQEDSSDVIRITGNKEGLDRAQHEIQLISDQQAKLAFERLNIPKIYHPFIQGANNSRSKALAESTGARVNIPPPSVMKDEITVAGEKEGVKKAADEINKIYYEKKQKCQTVSVEVNKKQHKYVIGPRGQGLQDVMAQYEVSVEVPSLDSDSSQITLRGEPQALGSALTLVYSKANSVVTYDVAAPSWLHRFIIGKGGVKVKKLMSEVPKVHIEFTDGEDRIQLEGPPEEVTKAQKELESVVAELKRTMDYAEVKINKKYHRNIIGKSGANRQRLMKETDTNIRIPPEDDPTDLIRIEGDPAGVKKVKAELLEMAKKMDNEKSRDILIEQRFHRQLIGQSGKAIKEIRDMFNQVQISLPGSAAKSDVVGLRGPKQDVDKAYKYLEKLHKDLVLNNYQGEVRIFKDFHKNIIGKGGATIKKIREETNTKIDLPSQISDSDSIKITGKQADVEKAIAMIEKIQKELANIAEETLIIPHSLHNAVIGAKGRLIKAIMDECGGVLIRFPAETASSDKVVIRGPKDDVENAKTQLLELVEDRKVNSYSSEIKAKPEFHKFLIGRGGVNIKKVREKYGARVIFPTLKDDQPELITIIGKKEGVEAAKEDLIKQIEELEKIVEDTVEVPTKWHKNFIARRGEMLNQIAADFGGVSVSFPRSGSDSTSVRLSGAKDCVAGAKQRITEIVDELESMVSIDCVIPQKFHRQVLGTKGIHVQQVTKQFNVQVKFPERPKQETPATEEANGDADAVENGDAQPSSDVIVITGKKEACEEARDALLALVPVTKTMEIPFEFHRHIIGTRGKDIRALMDQHDANVSIPPGDKESDTVTISGPEANVQGAMEALAERVKELEADKADQELRKYQLEVCVDPKHHPKIIGRGGAIIRKLRTENQEVNIQMPSRDAEEPDKITITGYEASAKAAKDAILKIVADLEAMTTIEVEIDARVHNRIIGRGGSQVKKLMEEFKVDVRFPRGDDRPGVIEITGDEDACYDCRDELLNLEEEYMQDVLERVEMEQYTKPSRQAPPKASAPQPGFMVTDAPWDTASTDDFPSIGDPKPQANGGGAGQRFGAWGKK